MTAVRISELVKTFPATSRPALDGVSLGIEAGEMLVLLGPSGCGKTTILRCLAGLEQPSDGSITIGDQVVFDKSRRIDVAPERRNLGMVFQSYGLWPHMTVLENIRFPLRARGHREGLRGQWAEKVAEVVSCSHLLDRRPGELSGGQQQRIALARALVGRPSLMLFDEPLSNLDARLRADLRTAVRELHREFRFTGVYVTHDQEEGLTVGDRIAVMNEGSVVQFGSPGEVHRNPATSWTADFMGMTNTVSTDRAGDLILDARGVTRQVATLQFRCDDGTLTSAGSADPVKPDGIVLRDSAVIDRAYSGNHTEFTLGFAGSRLRLRLPSHAAAGLPDAGGAVDVHLGLADVRAFDERGDHVGIVPTPVLAS